MNDDDFATAAQDEAVKRWPHLPHRPETHVLAVGKRIGFDLGASWARAHLAEQEPTLAEVTAAIHAYDSVVEGLGGDYAPGAAILAALSAARKARP